MSYAWHQLRCAVRALNRSCDRRTQLAGAYSKLVKLRNRDLPAELVDDFERLVGGISRFPAKNVFREIKSRIASLDDGQVAEAITLISTMHDVLEMYQPRRGRSLEFDASEILPASMETDIVVSLS